MKLGINSYTLMWAIGFQGVNPACPERAARPQTPLTAMGLLEIARQYGIHLVQTGTNLPFEDLSEAMQNEFIYKARDLGIGLELGTRGLDADHLIGSVALARRMGARLIRTLPEIDGQYVTCADQIPLAVERVLPALEREGIQLAIENGKIPAANLRAALDEIGSPYVGVVLDMVNSLAIPEGWKEVTRLLAPHTMCLHYKDFAIRRAWHMMGFICEGAPAGQGMVETRWLLEQLAASPYDYNIIIELWPPEQKTLEESIALERCWLEQSIAYMRKFVQA